MRRIIAVIKSGIFQFTDKKDGDLKIQVGEIKGTYDYFKSFKRKHPTYDTIESDYLTK